jgi:hypothetical protein
MIPPLQPTMGGHSALLLLNINFYSTFIYFHSIAPISIAIIYRTMNTKYKIQNMPSIGVSSFGWPLSLLLSPSLSSLFLLLFSSIFLYLPLSSSLILSLPLSSSSFRCFIISSSLFQSLPLSLCSPSSLCLPLELCALYQS